MTTSESSDIIAINWYSPIDGTVSSASVAAIGEYVERGGRAIVCDGSTIEVVRVKYVDGRYRLSLESSPGKNLRLPVR